MNLLILNIMSLLFLNLAIGDDWELVKQTTDLSIYVRYVEDSAIKEVKIDGNLTCELKELVAALEDIPGQKEWLMRTMDAYILDDNGFGQFSYYLSTDLPFPVKDRDIIVAYKRSYDPTAKKLEIAYHDLKDRLPENNKLVRIPTMQARYLITEKADNVITLEYYLKIDIGGVIPNWVVNMAITKGPESTMNSLFEIIRSGKYKNAEVLGL